MKIKNIVCGIIISLLFLQSNATATSEFGKIDVYFNDQILPGKMIATPTLKIGEPFNVKVNVTVYQECKVSGQISEIESGNFEVVEGPSQMNRYFSVELKPNESHIFEWTIKPTEGWAGGSLPINFRYSLLEKGNPEPILNSGFTVAYCTISNEHYEGETPTSEQPKSENKSTQEQPSSENSSSPASSPAFSLVTVISTLVLVFLKLPRQ
ncbi:sarcinarray family MAST domain-containing protein [Methanosarcina sp.]|uniref:sarcinarray family MAST domain-containing protein n=1 Tax=Methanosarcina sp. TaxID=2213 RepID=UPI0029884AD8|nr:sarcinarray family MAST domain-containing protein [Methanosarcina sp.]MDW5549878.1 sarcinarray family MAST domain-containing protein [Methanosarcina sp.]MDW5552482.1 sarcinarray family MAST domain-containing protein [Methanosarcina sp.]MDW5560212.1 sarcinarray family MAST domain-containing protein [Methanosarcina sp.]